MAVLGIVAGIGTSAAGPCWNHLTASVITWDAGRA